MARTSLATQAISLTGTVPTFTPANADGHMITVPAKGVILAVNNASGAPITVTLDATGTMNGVAYTDPSGSVGAGTVEYFGLQAVVPLDQGSGVVHVNFSATADVTVAALRI